MQKLSDTLFAPRGLYRHGHLSTIIPSVFGKKPRISYQRERLDLADGDFIDLDRLYGQRDKLMILCHGLEGSSSSIYMLIFAHHFHQLGWDIIAMNYRGCSGEMNRSLTMYNSGTTGDLHEVIVEKSRDYRKVALIGFSLGGNLVLKYLGEQKHPVDSRIAAGVAISVPVHLSDASQELLKKQNVIYQYKFLKTLTSKIREKKKQFPDDISLKYLSRVNNLYDFDQYYTAPLFGYSDAEDYYSSNQSIQWLHQIDIPSLIINARNDPFLGPLCYPSDIVKGLENVDLLVPEYGGHVGFAYSWSDRSWLLKNVEEFLQ